MSRLLSIALLTFFALSHGQAPTTLSLKAKLRDFHELPDGNGPPYPGDRHPDFNNDAYASCSGTGYVSNTIRVDPIAPADSIIFPYDNRNPTLVKQFDGSGKRCFTDDPPTTTRFDQWFNDKDASINRPFLTTLQFNLKPGTTTANPVYEYLNDAYFPLDANNAATSGGAYTDLPGQTLNTFGHSTGGGNTNHNFGFTMEFHANFTYKKGNAAAGIQPQTFNFTGDDDVWAYINGKLVIDLGGIHVAENASVNLDDLGLTDGESYILDFFFAERHTTESHCKISTSLQLESNPPKVATPVATPGATAFNSQLSISLTDATPGTTIYYTTNGTAPDSNSAVYSTPTTTGTPINVTKTTTIKAIAYKSGWIKSDVLTQVYTKKSVPSTLVILDQNGNPLTGGYLTQLNTAYTIKITTTQAGLTTLSPAGSTKTAGDAEVITLSNPQSQGDNFIFSGATPFVIATAVANNGKTEASVSGYDSLIVKWINPLDPTDVAEKHVLVRPAPVQATAYFSTNANGSDATTQYAGTETTIYYFVKDEVLPAGSKPQVTLQTTRRVGTVVTPEDAAVLDLNLNPSPGVYGVAIPVSLIPTPATGDKIIQMIIDDQIKGTYSDPYDAESPAIAVAGFGSAPELEASLEFTDKDGVVLPSNVYYSPAAGFLYLTYKDDWVGGTMDSIPVTLTIVNNFGNAAPDSEVFKVTLNLAKHSGNTGVWDGSIKLASGPTITRGNGVAETYILGNVHATVQSHTKSGSPVGPLAFDDLLVAYPNLDGNLKIVVPGKTTTGVDRADTLIQVIAQMQSLSSAKDTLYATLSCSESKDQVVNVMLIEKDVASGTYESKIISKTEGAVFADGVLQCKPSDVIIGSVKVPPYNDTKEIRVVIDNPVTTTLTYSLSPDGATPVSSVQEGKGSVFYAVVNAQSPSLTQVDTILVTFTTPQGETETFKAIETGIYSQKFVAQVPFKFVQNTNPTVNGILEGKILPNQQVNFVTATGQVTVGGGTVKTNVDLQAALDPIVKAYIKDSNGDGSGDKVYVVFQNKLSRLPTTLQVQWNDTVSTPKIGPADGTISFLNGDSTTVVLTLSKPYAIGLTGVAKGQIPNAVLPNDAFFQGQKPAIVDSIGPILISAVKHPGVVNPLVTKDPNLTRDTLFITLSEPIKAGKDFNEILKFATSCSDYAHSTTITPFVEPTPTNADSTSYKVIVDNATATSPSVTDCIFLNADPGKYSDMPGNPVPIFGVKLTGNNRQNAIQVFRGYPPVVGLDPATNGQSYLTAVNDSHDPVTGFATNDDNKGFKVLWLPPVNFVDGAPFTPYTITDGLKNLPKGNSDGASPVAVPTNISALQVVTTSPYIAHISIFDITGNFVNSSDQVFGAMGEFANMNRRVKKGVLGYLVWNTKDSHGQLAGQGVYVWKVRFEFADGKQEVQYTRTGLLRKK